MDDKLLLMTHKNQKFMTEEYFKDQLPVTILLDFRSEHDPLEM